MHASLPLTAIAVLGLGAISSLPGAEVERKAIKVSASSWEQKAHGGWGDMPPERALDGDLKTAWMAEGDGEWIQFDLGSAQPLTAVKLAFAKGDQRVYTFSIQVSETGQDKTWTTVVDKAKSSSKTLEFETYAITTAAVRYVRILGFGNTSEKFPKWCNITEAAFVTK